MTFFLTDSATTEIYTYGHTLSLHDALPISNNQLATPEAGFILARRGILFAPDYVMNAGGIISGLEATNSMPGRSRVDFPRLGDSLARIHDRLLEIFERAAGEGRPPEVAAEEMARELIGR